MASEAGEEAELEQSVDLQQALSAIELFHEISEAGMLRIIAIADEVRLEDRAVVFRQGDIGDKLYLVLDGRIRISRNLGEVGEETLAILGPGEAFGEMALMDDAERSADAHVHQACHLLTITREAFEDLLFIHKDLAYEILWNCTRILCRRLREANDKMAFLSITSRF